MKFQVFIAQASVPLPDYNQVYDKAFGMAWPQVLAFSSACLGILAVAYLAKTLWGKS